MAIYLTFNNKHASYDKAIYKELKKCLFTSNKTKKCTFTIQKFSKFILKSMGGHEMSKLCYYNLWVIF